MRELIKKYWWVIALVIVAISAISYICHDYMSGRTKAAIKASDKSVNAASALIASQDKTVERVYTNVKKEVQAKNAEIQRAVKALSPDAVAVSLDALVNKYRRERIGD